MRKWEREERETSWPSHLVGRWGWITSLILIFHILSIHHSFRLNPLCQISHDYVFLFLWFSELFLGYFSVSRFDEFFLDFLHWKVIFVFQSWVNPLALTPSIWGFGEFFPNPRFFVFLKIPDEYLIFLGKSFGNVFLLLMWTLGPSFMKFDWDVLSLCVILFP